MKRLTGRKLQRLRRYVFARNPLCVLCEARGFTRPAVELDHITPISQGGSDRLDNLQGLCRACHDSKTRRDLGYKDSGACDVAGHPLDPHHPWNATGEGGV